MSPRVKLYGTSEWGHGPIRVRDEKGDHVKMRCPNCKERQLVNVFLPYVRVSLTSDEKIEVTVSCQGCGKHWEVGGKLETTLTLYASKK